MKHSKVEVVARTVNILGVRVHAIDRDTILTTAINWASEDQGRVITYANAHCLNLAVGDKEYKAILNRSDLVIVDGVSVVWAGRLLDGVRLYKVTYRTFIYELCGLAERIGLRLYFLAGKPGVVKLAVQNLINQFPHLQVVGASDGFFFEKEETSVLREIKEKRPDILFVGMGAPKQELWIDRNRDKIDVPLSWASGAMLDYVAGIEPVVPAWMGKIALEWLWRLMMNPHMKWKRYLVGNPIFILRVLRQKFEGKY